MSQTYRSANPQAAQREPARVDDRWIMRHGAIIGALAGVVYAVGAMGLAWISKGKQLLPLQMIAGILFQRPPVGIEGGAAIVVGTTLHMIYSVAAGVVVAWVVASVPALRSSRGATVAFSTILNLVMWPIDFYVIAPLINAPWFARDTDPLQEAVLNALFGLVIGLYLAVRLPKRTIGGK